jgi:hypothetical protein
VTEEALRITDGKSHCRVREPNGGVVEIPLVEISRHGAFLQTQRPFELNACLDLELALLGQAPRQLFGTVEKCGDGDLRLKWVVLDAADEGRLGNLLDAYAARPAPDGKTTCAGASASPPAKPATPAKKDTDRKAHEKKLVKPKPATSAPADAQTAERSGSRRLVRPRTQAGDEGQKPKDQGSSSRSGTRRIVRPSATAITPFSSPVVGEPPPERVGTRRIVRPSQMALTPFAEPAPPMSTPPVARQGSSEAAGAHPALPAADPHGSVALEAKPTREQAPETKSPNSFSHKLKAALDRLDPNAELKLADPTDSPAVVKPSAPVTPPVTVPITASAPSTNVAPASSAAAGSGSEAGLHPSGRHAIIDSEGRMDISASIRSHSKTVRSSELAARHERVRVLNMVTIKDLIQEAVEEAAAHLTRSLNEAERKRLLEEAEDGFQDRLKTFEAEKLSADVRIKQLSDQLKSAQTLLEDERKRTIAADQFTVSAEGLGEIDSRMQRLLSHAVGGSGVNAEFEAELRRMVAHVLDSEREKLREKELGAQNAKIELLERKIGRLANSLEETEKQRDEAQRLAQFLESQGGGALRNVFTAGLQEADPNKEKKMALMKIILEENRELRKALGIALRDPNAPDPDPDPDEKPVANQEMVKKEELSDEQLEKLVDALSPSAKAAAPTPPASASLPEAEAPPEAGTDNVGGGINPDDEPWEIKPLDNLNEGVNESGIKRIAVTVAVAPPPLERKAKAGGQA